MGIQGLLPLMKSIMVPIHIKELKGCTVAVDTYSWLHKGALSCSKDLCLGLPTSRHVDYCMHRVNLLRHYGVKPILVFDGGLLPMKSDEEVKRSRARKENLERAVEHESAGNSAAAYDCYQKAVDISPSVARELIEVLKEENVDYIVAPYEADAQMAFLSINNLVEAIITEDSDLIPFGCSRKFKNYDKVLLTHLMLSIQKSDIPIGLASLEARRNLKVARAIPKHSQLRQEPAPSMRNHSSEPSCMGEAAICTMNCSPGSPTGSQKLLDVLPLKVPVEACITATETNLSGFPHRVDQKARSISKENLYSSEPTANLQQSCDDVAKPSMSISRNHESISALDAVADRAGKRKVVRSRFFKSNILDKNDHDREKTKSDAEEGGDIAPFTYASLKQHKDDHVYESAKSVVEKQDQNMTLRNNDADSNDIPENNGSSMETDNKEVNFGCDISHLSRYSDISEKSMERFVSVISSFRYMGSGSRASGLRAPLKDVRNTCAVRSPTVPMDLSKYAYIPNTRKAASAGRKK
ncbi:hypothetical protein ACLOJK_029816 [Asimina triloba]